MNDIQKETTQTLGSKSVSRRLS